jgi:hypothetical protein
VRARGDAAAMAFSGRGGLASGHARAGDLSNLRARAKGAEARGATCHDMASHGGGHGRLVQGGGANFLVDLHALGRVEVAG